MTPPPLHRSVLADLAAVLPLREVAADFPAGAELEDLADDYATDPDELRALLTEVGFFPLGEIARCYWRREPVETIANSDQMSGRTSYRLLSHHGIARNGATRIEVGVPSAEVARRYLEDRR
ncbi:hypothetical protein ACFVQ9_25945 [Streptomyces goshikiensis]|uniref:hypothetical protein n=1 Tax=Streptomyces goshikiensis TaxID=1942 RepID=UPI0036C96C08